jgi:F-type H+-transporting ATPase subunit delta
MAELATLARPYTEALLKLAKEGDNFEQWSTTLNYLNEVIITPEIASLCANPWTDKVKIKQLLLDICVEQIDEQGINLVKLLANNRRLALIPELLRQFKKRKSELDGCIKATVISTYVVKPAQKIALAHALKQRLGKDVEIEVEIDRSLLGGWLIRADNQVFDLSVRGRFQQLAANLNA